MSKQQVSNGGFSLLEVVVALTVVVASIGVIYAALSSSINRKSDDAEYRRAMDVAIVLMEEIGVSRPLEVGAWSESVEDSDLHWSIAIKQEQGEESQNTGVLYEVSVEVGSDVSSEPMVSLKTFKIDIERPPT